jgi:S-methylmethionine-dependent homocysteine/selenocysteine methylase
MRCAPSPSLIGSRHTPDDSVSKPLVCSQEFPASRERTPHWKVARRYEAAVDWLQEAYAERDWLLWALETDPIFDCCAATRASRICCGARTFLSDARLWRRPGRTLARLSAYNHPAMSSYDRIDDLLKSGATVVLDGAMGSELVRRGVRWRWHGLLTDADQVRALHEEYIAAGADVIRTNTFQLNDRTYLDVFRSREHMRHIGAPDLETRASELTLKAVAVAREARSRAGRDVAIAGVIGPLEHCFRPDLAPAEAEARAEHGRTARAFAEAGVDLILLESMNTIAEARAAAQTAVAAGLPVWGSFVLGPEGEILSREPLVGGVRALVEAGVGVVAVNCSPPDDTTQAVGRLGASNGRAIGAYAHIGKFDPPSWKFEFHPQFTGTDLWSPARYVETARGWRNRGARVIGGCCGTTPAHVRALREAL